VTRLPLATVSRRTLHRQAKNASPPIGIGRIQVMKRYRRSAASADAWFDTERASTEDNQGAANASFPGMGSTFSTITRLVPRTTAVGSRTFDETPEKRSASSITRTLLTIHARFEMTS